MIDSNIIDKILFGVRIIRGDNIIEVGFGIGIFICEMGKIVEKVVVIEIDRNLIFILKDILLDLDNIEVVN